MTTETNPTDIIRQWWQAHHDDKCIDPSILKADYPALRRCKNIQEVMYTRAYYQLDKRLNKTKWKNKLAIANIANICAYIEAPEADQDSNTPLGKLMAQTKSGSESTPRVSELRFLRFIKNKTQDSLFLDLIRMIKLIGKRNFHPTQLKELSQLIYTWSYSNAKQNLTYSYFDNLK